MVIAATCGCCCCWCTTTSGVSKLIASLSVSPSLRTRIAAGRWHRADRLRARPPAGARRAHRSHSNAYGIRLRLEQPFQFLLRPLLAADGAFPPALEASLVWAAIEAMRFCPFVLLQDQMFQAVVRYLPGVMLLGRQLLALSREDAAVGPRRRRR